MQQAAGVAAADGAGAAAGAAGVAAAEGGGGPPVGTEAIGAGRWWGKIMLVVGTWRMGWPTESTSKKTGKKCNKKTRERIYLHLLVRDNTWADPLNPRVGPWKWRAGPYRARVSWAALSMSWAGPGRADIFETLMGRAGPGRENWKMRCAGPGRGPSSDSRAAAHQMKN